MAQFCAAATGPPGRLAWSIIPPPLTGGAKHVLDLAEGATENAATVQAMLDNLIERGLDPERPRLYIVDGAKALSKAIRRTFGRATALQRCQVHKGRNITDRLDESLHAGVRKVLRQAWQQDDAANPYLLRGLMIERANHVWCADITYIPVRRGFLYLAAIMDWASRHVLAWRLSNTLDAGFCTDALDEALARHGTPEIFNTDQGSQFTGFAFTGRLREAGIRISMDGRGQYLDNIFIERLWRSLKYEAVYLRELADGFEARRVIGEWIDFYNTERPHSALGGKTPAEAYRGAPPVDMMDKPLRALPTSPQAQQQRQGDRFKEILAA